MPSMARGENRPVTVHMIAKHVGISPAAVSTVLSNRHEERRLAPATVERIRQAVRELGYVPNVAARRLRAHDPEVRHMELGILTSFEAPLFLVSRTLRQVQQAVDARTSADRRFSVTIDMFHAGRWDYVFTVHRQGIADQRRRLAVFFSDGRLDRFEGDEMPGEADVVARLDPRARAGARVRP